MFSGVFGVPTGSFLAQHLRQEIPNCDPLICAFGLLVSGPLAYISIIFAGVSSLWTLVFVFLAEVTLNMTWSLVADILLVRKKNLKSIYLTNIDSGSC